MATHEHSPSLRGFARPIALAWSWSGAALGGVLLLAAALYAWRLDQDGYANLYYAAAVRSMLASWHNFFFVAFDPGGFVSVDKPPLGLWLQVASAKVLGYQGWSLLLPQAAAGVASVVVLYRAVQREVGAGAGLLAALALTLTPITVATARNSTSDVPLVLILLVAAVAVLRATATGRLRWLLASAALVGVGFNVKMLQAFLPLPAFFLTYLLGAPGPWRARVAHLAVATLALLGVALPWAVVVDLTPPDQRPYVGSSADNTVRNLIVDYNGLNRLLGMRGPGGPGEPGGPPLPGPGGPGSPQPPPGAPFPDGAPAGGGFPGTPAGSSPSAAGVPGPVPGVAPAPDFPPGAGSPPGPPPGGPGGSGENGAPGPLRLFDAQLGGQIGWLLPLALFGLVAAAVREGRRWPLSGRQQALVLWGTWLLVEAIFFSVAGMFHRYYLVMLGPPIAALVGIGGVALWDDYRAGSPRGWLLPLALLATAVVQLRLLDDYPDWSDRLGLLVGALTVAAALGLIAGRLAPRLGRSAAPALAARLGGLALLVAPAIWAAYPLADAGGMRGPLPFAGPPESMGGPFGPPGRFGPPPPGWAGAASDPLAPPFGPPGVAGGPPPGGPPPPDPAATDPRLLDYLQANRGDARFLYAVPSAMQAAPVIIATGEPVMALGGFTGGDPILTPDALASLVARNTVRFFLLPAAGGFPFGPPGPAGFPGGPPAVGEFSVGPPPVDGFPGGPPGPPGLGRSEITRWVSDHCAAVPAAFWRSDGGMGDSSRPAAPPAPPGFGGAMQLYDCASPAGSTDPDHVTVSNILDAASLVGGIL